MLKHIPNILTTLRLFLIPIIINLIFSENYVLGIIIFSISGITDIIDGFIARKYNIVSNFGKLMDPLADKLTQLSVIGSLTILSFIPEWIFIIVFVKDFSMIVASAFLYGKDVVVYSKWYGKFATTLYYLAIVVALLDNVPLLSSFNYLSTVSLILFIIASIFTLTALILYARDLYKKGLIKTSDFKK